MSAEVLTLRDLDAPSTAVAVKPDAALAPAPVTIKSAVLALFKPMEADLLALAKRHENVAYDMSTPKGLAIAKASRHELRESGRFAVQRLRDKTKEQLNDGKKVVESEADRLIAIVKPVEDHVHGQIEAREQQLAAEKAVRDRIEAKRIARHADAIAVIAGYVDQAHGKPSDKIAAGIDYVQTIDVGAEVFEEFAAQAGMVKIDTLAKLLVMHEKALRDEADAAERERQRVENARVAAELAEQKRLLDEQAAELARLKAEAESREQAAIAAIRQQQEDAERRERERHEAAQQEIEAARQRAITPAASVATEGKAETPEPGTLEAAPITHTPEQDSQHVLKAEAARPDATDRETPAHASPVGGPMGVGQPAAAGPVDEIHVPALPPAVVVPDIGELLADCFEFTKFVAAPFFVASEPSPEWWTELKERIERLQPLLEQAIAAREAA